jgi:hypothetical protein
MGCSVTGTRANDEGELGGANCWRLGRTMRDWEACLRCERVAGKIG